MNNGNSICIALVLAFGSASVHALAVGDKAKLNRVELFDGTKFDPKSVESSPTLVYF